MADTDYVTLPVNIVSIVDSAGSGTRATLNIQLPPGLGVVQSGFVTADVAKSDIDGLTTGAAELHVFQSS
jgi:hypothetical protein